MTKPRLHRLSAKKFVPFADLRDRRRPPETQRSVA
jgi:hypothetical protein